VSTFRFACGPVCADTVELVDDGDAVGAVLECPDRVLCLSVEFPQWDGGLHQVAVCGDAEAGGPRAGLGTVMRTQRDELSPQRYALSASGRGAAVTHWPPEHSFSQAAIANDSNHAWLAG
jgi:hypothetical protein